MQKKVSMIFAMVFFVMISTLALAQSSAPADQGPPPGPGYGMEPGGGYGPYGPGSRHGMGSGMMGPDSRGGYGMGPGMMGQGWGGYGMGPGMMGPGYGYGMGPWMFVFMSIFLLLVIVGIVLLVRYLSPHAKTKPSEGALEILKHRYARGEIQKAEFEEKRKDLES
jgi:putative membrane protein